MIPVDQETVISSAVEHVKRGNKQVFEFTGGPGTGKTYCIHEIVRRLNIPMDRIAPMTYIGQAAIVMRTRGLYNARTIHSYRETDEERETYAHKTLKKGLSIRDC